MISYTFQETNNNYFRCFILCILIPRAFQFNYGKMLAKFLIAPHFEMRRLLEGGAYFNMRVKWCGTYQRETLT